MHDPLCSDEDFIRLVEQKGINATARTLGCATTNVHARRSRLERILGRTIISANAGGVRRSKPEPTRDQQYPHRITIKVKDGIILVGSDAHYWPGHISTAHQGFVKFCKRLKPKAVVLNGDIFDAATASRHPPIGWETRPTLIDEIDECKARLEEIGTSAKGATRAWCLGNHDARFETRLATMAPEYANVHGVHLRDHFPDWPPCWSVWVNNNIVIKHRFKNGIHAPHNNVMWAGKTIITGHLHSQKVIPITDYNGDRWGVDAGTLAEVYGEQFTDYTEDSPRNWRAGFVVLHFVGGKLLQPQLARVVDATHIDYCGQLWQV